MGALTRLDLADRHTPAAERWMTFIRETPELEGVDIHPHVEHPDAVQPFLDYILPRMRADQTFLVTEFSLVWHWKAHLRNADRKSTRLNSSHVAISYVGFCLKTKNAGSDKEITRAN